MMRQAIPAFTGMRCLWLSYCAFLLVLCGCASDSTVGPSGQTRGRSSLFGSKGTPWTIQCREQGGPLRAEHVKQIAETLRQTAGIRPDDVFVVDGSDGIARLYYGTYFRRIDRKSGKHITPKKLRHDLDLIRRLGTGPGELYFFHARIVRTPTPDVGNPLWSLSSVDATYSLQVAVFEPTENFWEFKQAGAEYCKLLRDRGFEAYYHHTDSCSMVTVGSFGPQAVYVTGKGVQVLSREVTELQQSDDLLKYNHLNGSVYRVKSSEGTMIPMPSRLVEIPKRQGSEPW
ncbi:MAG: hypothetical protein JSU63_13945 [Phycisphaerales bacterium]|nr:MAG: hypothetical protein JSU63_13945 [Phycisphaerales bacterium]